MRTVHIPVEEVLDVLIHIKVDKSLGPNLIYPRTLRYIVTLG